MCLTRPRSFKILGLIFFIKAIILFSFLKKNTDIVTNTHLQKQLGKTKKKPTTASYTYHKTKIFLKNQDKSIFCMYILYNNVRASGAG